MAEKKIDVWKAATKVDGRAAITVAYFSDEKLAARFAAQVRSEGRTYNGGYFDGMTCGRERDRDYFDKEHGQLYAVTM